MDSDNEKLVRRHVDEASRAWAQAGGNVGMASRIVNKIACAILDDHAHEHAGAWLEGWREKVAKQIEYFRQTGVEARYRPAFERWCIEERWRYVPEVPKQESKQANWLEGV